LSLSKTDDKRAKIEWPYYGRLFVSCRSGLDLGGWGKGASESLVEPPKVKKKKNETLYYTLIWPQNARNPISKDLDLKILQGRTPSDPPTGDRHWWSVSQTPFLKSCIHLSR